MIFADKIESDFDADTRDFSRSSAWSAIVRSQIDEWGSRRKEAQDADARIRVQDAGMHHLTQLSVSFNTACL